MKILVGSFAGAGSNLLKFLTWCIVKKEEDIVFFFYANKAENDHPHMVPFNCKHDNHRQSIYEDSHRNIFYKLFEPPTGYTAEHAALADVFEMHFPFYIQAGKFEAYGLKSPPDYFKPFIDQSIFTEALYNDSTFPLFRTLYHTLWKQHLTPTKYLQAYLDIESYQIQMRKKEGKRILAAFIRSPVHFHSSSNEKSYQFTDIVNELETTLKEYDYFLPITQVKPYYEYLEEFFPTKLIRLARPRHGEMTDWTCIQYTEQAFLDEVRTAIVDIYLASQCDMVLGGLSNMLTSTLFLNPTIPFKVFDCLKGKVSY